MMRFRHDMAKRLCRVTGAWSLVAGLAVGTGALLGSCSGDNISPFSSITGGGKGDDDDGGGGGGDGPGSGVDQGDELGKSTKNIANSGNFQVKSVDLLKNSIDACMGDGMLTVTAEMILPATGPAPALPDGKKAFLMPGRYAPGENIVDQVANDLVDPTRGNRTGIVSDSMTASYLQSLETIANVVAHNCSADKEECQCEDTEKSFEIIKRCLPGMDPNTEELENAAEMVGLVCAEDPSGAGMRKAIASLLSSYAFAAAR